MKRIAIGLTLLVIACAHAAFAGGPVMIPDTGNDTDIVLPSHWTLIQDTGIDTLTLGMNTDINFGMTPNADGFIVTNYGWQNMVASAPATVYCRYWNQINNQLEPNLMGSNAMWMMTVPKGPFSMPIQPVTLERNCTVNASCVAPLRNGDILEIATQCYAVPGGVVTVKAYGGDMFTTIWPMP